VTGCIQKEDDKMYVTLLSKRSRNHIRFSINGKGYVSLHHQRSHIIDPDYVFGNPISGELPNSELPSTEELPKAPRPSARVLDPETIREPTDIDYAVDYTGIVPFAMQLKLRIGYDDGFLNSFKNSQEAQEAVAAVVTHVQPYFTVESFHHHIYFNIAGDPIHVPQSMNLSTVRTAPDFAETVAIDWVRENDKDPETGLYAFISGSRGKWGVLGIAKPQSVCAKNGTSPIRVCVSYGTKNSELLETARVMTQGIAHNIGIKNPWVFRADPNNSTAQKAFCLERSNGAAIQCGECHSFGPKSTDQCCSGFMGQVQQSHKNKRIPDPQMGWSRCSVKSFEEEYAFHRWQRKRCLPAVEPRTEDFPTAAPKPAPPTAESRFAPTPSPEPLFQSTTKWGWKERPLVKEQGDDARVEPTTKDHPSKGLSLGFDGRTLAQCQHECETLDSCHSISYREFDGACFWKNKCVTMDEPDDPDPVFGWKTYFMPVDEICKLPTPSPTKLTLFPTFPPTKNFKRVFGHKYHL